MLDSKQMQPDRSNESTLRFACAGDDQGNESCSYVVQYVTVTVSVTVCVVNYHLEMTKVVQNKLYGLRQAHA